MSPRLSGQQMLQHTPVDARQPVEIRDGDTFVNLVDGPVEWTAQTALVPVDRPGWQVVLPCLVLEAGRQSPEAEATRAHLVPALCSHPAQSPRRLPTATISSATLRHGNILNDGMQRLLQNSNMT